MSRQSVQKGYACNRSAFDDSVRVKTAGKGKTELIIKALGRKRGASIPELSELTGWQPHSVRGFISGTLRGKHGLSVVREVGKSGVSRYRIEIERELGAIKRTDKSTNGAAS